MTGSDSEVGRERHGDLAREKIRDGGIGVVGGEDVAGKDGEGELVLGVQSRQLAECNLELTIEAAEDDPTSSQQAKAVRDAHFELYLHLWSCHRVEPPRPRLLNGDQIEGVTVLARCGTAKRVR